MGDESVHLRRFHSDEVMVIFFITECAAKFDSKFESRPINRNCYDWIKKYAVMEVVASAFWRLCPAKVLFAVHNLQNGVHNLGHNHKSLYLCPRL